MFVAFALGAAVGGAVLVVFFVAAFRHWLTHRMHCYICARAPSHLFVGVDLQKRTKAEVMLSCDACRAFYVAATKDQQPPWKDGAS